MFGLACLILFPATSAQGQRPTLTISSGSTFPTRHEFRVTFRFSESMTGFDINDIEVTNGTKSDFVSGGRTYTVEITPEDNFDGDVTVRVPAGVATATANPSGRDNRARSESFEVDTEAPVLDLAEVDGATLTLLYDQTLDPTSVPATNEFEMRVAGTRRTISDVALRGDEVRLTLAVGVTADDVMLRLDYTGFSIRDGLRNEASILTDEFVENLSSRNSDAPSAPRDLYAEGDGERRIYLSWRVPLDDRGFPIIGYRIQESRNEGTTWTDLEDNTYSTATEYTHTGLTPGSTRHYRVSAINSAGVGATSNVASATTDGGAPDPPTRLTATADGSTRIDLAWRAARAVADGVTGYRIEVSNNGRTGWSNLVADTDSKSTTHTHTGLRPGTTRHYRVSAINDFGRSDPSDVASATTTATVPGPPASLSATATGSTMIRLNWSPPAADGGGAVRGYRIEVSNSGFSGWSDLVLNTGSTAITYTHTGLAPGTTRYYRVSAINSIGKGAPSAVANATTSATVPSQPPSLRATASGKSSINLAWTAPLTDGGASVTGYRIQVSDNAGASWVYLVVNTRSTQTTYTHRGLPPASTRHYRVSAINSVGVSDPSGVASTTTNPDVPRAPTRLMATANGQSQIDLSWNTPANDGGASIIGYRIEVSINNGVRWTVLRSNTGTTATVFPHSGLQPGTTHHYRVSAVNRAGVGATSNVANATTDATVPGAPTRLAAVANGSSQIDLSWQTPFFNGGSRITGYRIEVSENRGAIWTDLVSNTRSTATTYPHTGLAPATTRHYRVSAINSVGTSTKSGVATATTDAIAPDPPTDLQATATEATRIDLTWTAPAYNGGAAVTSYRIEVSTDAGVSWSDLVRETNSATTAYGHGGLQPGSTRHYRVSAINAAGTGDPSNVATATTDDPRERAGRVNAEVLPYAAAAMTASTISAITGRIDAVAAGRDRQRRVDLGGFSSMAGSMSSLARGSQSGLQGPGNGALAPGVGPGFGAGQLLDGTSFVVPFGLAGEGQQADAPGKMATWGGGEWHTLSAPSQTTIDWSGDVLSIHVGADLRVRPDILAGVAGTRSIGAFDFTDATGAKAVDGTYETELNSVNPYVAWFSPDGSLSAWGTAGLGWGEVRIQDPAAGIRTSGTRMMSGAVGGSGDLLASGMTALRVKTEGWIARVDLDGSEEVDALSLDVQRARLSLEWTQGYRLASGQELAVIMEGGTRYDDGDGANGGGIELGGGLRFVVPSLGLTAEGHGRVLATHREGHEEWGVRGVIQIDPNHSGAGLSVRLTPEWGDGSSGVQQLWDRGASGLPGVDLTPPRGQLNAELEYGLPAFNGTPYGRFYIVEGGGRAFGSGVRYEITRVMDLRLEGTRHESTVGPARHGFTMRGQLKFR